MLLQGFEIFKGVDLTKITGMDQAHEQIAHVNAMLGLVKQMVFPVKNTFLSACSHRLLSSGDLYGLNQPALAFSAPSISGNNENGLLTMGEILKLKLNAEWIVLSVCNTGAAEGKRADAVSGLGRAFFYAGTRTILISMWPVETTSARKLTTNSFRYQKEDKKLSRAKALCKSVPELIDGPGFIDKTTGQVVARYARPLFWAPIIVGESGSNAN